MQREQDCDSEILSTVEGYGLCTSQNLSLEAQAYRMKTYMATQPSDFQRLPHCPPADLPPFTLYADYEPIRPIPGPIMQHSRF